jgi:hypothetical protein
MLSYSHAKRERTLKITEDLLLLQYVTYVCYNIHTYTLRITEDLLLLQYITYVCYNIHTNTLRII